MLIMTYWTKVIFQLHIKAFTMVEEIFTIRPSRKPQIDLILLNLIILFFTMVEEIFTIRPSRKLWNNLFLLNIFDNPGNLYQTKRTNLIETQFIFALSK